MNKKIFVVSIFITCLTNAICAMDKKQLVSQAAKPIYMHVQSHLNDDVEVPKRDMDSLLATMKATDAPFYYLRCLEDPRTTLQDKPDFYPNQSGKWPEQVWYVQDQEINWWVGYSLRMRALDNEKDYLNLKALPVAVKVRVGEDTRLIRLLRKYMYINDKSCLFQDRESEVQSILINDQCGLVISDQRMKTRPCKASYDLLSLLMECGRAKEINYLLSKLHSPMPRGTKLEKNFFDALSKAHQDAIQGSSASEKEEINKLIVNFRDCEQQGDCCIL